MCRSIRKRRTRRQSALLRPLVAEAAEDEEQAEQVDAARLRLRRLLLLPTTAAAPAAAGGGRGAGEAVAQQAPALQRRTLKPPLRSFRTMSQGGHSRCRWALKSLLSRSQSAPRPAPHSAQTSIGIDPIAGKVEGSGPVFAFSHNSNAALRAVNDLLAAGDTVTFAKAEGTIYAKGCTPAAILRKNGVDATFAQGSARGAGR